MKWQNTVLLWIPERQGLQILLRANVSYVTWLISISNWIKLLAFSQSLFLPAKRIHVDWSIKVSNGEAVHASNTSAPSWNSLASHSLLCLINTNSEQDGVAATLWTCIREVDASNLVRDNGYLVWGFPDFPQSLHRNDERDTWSSREFSFRNCYHAYIRRHIVWNTDSVIK